MYSRDDVLSNSDCKFPNARTPILLNQPLYRGIYRILMQIWRGKETWGRRRWRRICQHCLIANQKPYTEFDSQGIRGSRSRLDSRIEWQALGEICFVGYLVINGISNHMIINQAWLIRYRSWNLLSKSQIMMTATKAGTLFHCIMTPVHTYPFLVRCIKQQMIPVFVGFHRAYSKKRTVFYQSGHTCMVYESNFSPVFPKSNLSWHPGIS